MSKKHGVKRTVGVVVPVKKPFIQSSVAQAAVLFFFAYLLYSNTLKHEYVLDDLHVILSNKAVQMGVAGLPAIWTGANWYHGIQYRPIPGTLFALEHEFFGNSPHLGHLINVLLFAATCALLLLLLREGCSSGPEYLPILATALFAAHPIHTEVVANIKSADELLCFLSVLGSLVCTVKLVSILKVCPHLRVALYAASLLLFLAGLLSKETAITFVFIIPLYLYYFTKTSVKECFRIGCCFLAVSLVFLLVSVFAVKSLAGYGGNEILNNSLIGAPTLWHRLATAVLILGKYLKILMAPYPLVHDYGYNQIPVVSPLNPAAILSLLVYAAMIVYAVNGIRRKSILSFCAFFFLATLSIVSNVFILVGSTMGERLLYMPSFAFCLASAWLILRARERLKMKPISVVALILIVLTAYSILTISRNPAWHDNLTLFQTDISNAGNSATANASLGNMLIITSQSARDSVERRNLLQEAKMNLSRSVSIYPAYAYGQGNLGLSFSFLGEDDSAKTYFTKARILDPYDLISWVNLGDLYARAKDYDSSALCFGAVLKLDSANSYARLRRADVAALQGNYHKEIEGYSSISRRDPLYANAQRNLGMVRRYAQKDSAR